MKQVLLILDGAGDEELPELNGQTPLEAAFTPCLDALARQSALGRLRTTFEELQVESLACILGILGYDPRHHRHLRAALEALGRGLELNPEDLALRCNIVRLAEDGETLLDFTAGMPSDHRARQLLELVTPPDGSWELYQGQSYRNLLIIRNIRSAIPDIVESLVCKSPHMHCGEAVRRILPEGKTPLAGRLAGQLSALSRESYKKFSCMGEPAGKSGNMLWFSDPCGAPALPPFYRDSAKRAFMVAGLDFMRGLAKALSMDSRLIPGATGYTDTDYSAKAEAAQWALADHDFVLVHVNAPDEASHQREPREKVIALERVDRHIVGPLLEYLRRFHQNSFSFAVCADHITSSITGRHGSGPVPYLLHPGKNHTQDARLTERLTAELPCLHSLDLIENLCACHRQ
ncbi:MAG: hypothetical protein LBB52_01365 [Desulfovibrio sp.]|jgi:2,3-bisphosphoglycerate-independent phosphoglycerate mutase|nr:hypothetical protein [Desulfovibrio sp.]